MKEFTIRQATLADADALQECMMAAYSVYLETLKEISLPPLEVDYASEILNYPTWVAQREGKIVGGLIMTFEESCAVVSNIAVHPAAQGIGLGRALLVFAEQQARTKEITRMRLATHVLLTGNVSLYQHLGWNVVDQDSVRITMEKQIS
ncbi:MAG: hypothetical protein COB20_13800 [SAR86 cluster bacterium]|uniref:N-acetyltransferase domain-containing protein n=1 Tax=SAR86 cluster bacterium TaxID=2030880 RepID=A0A2A4WXB4_9GAMM|nr:MAG: hypothetical protein COB20_13800 [SAR86 cluster bacterium]